MIEWTLKKIIGTKNERELKRAWPKVARINALEAATQDEDATVRAVAMKALNRTG